MKIVIIDVVPDDVLTIALAGNVVYRPDLAFKSRTIVVAALEEIAADAVIATSRTLDAAVRSYAQGRRVCQVRVGIGDPFAAAQVRDETNCLQIVEVASADATSAYAAALDALENHATTGLTARPQGPFMRTAPRSVTLVGASIVNLITGFRLQEAGLDIRIVDAGPEPRADANWTAYGCSRGGDDARMFTLSEMDNYNDRIVSTQMNSIFNRRIDDLGWDLRRDARFSTTEKRWLADYELMPVWLAKRYNADIFVFNRESRIAWERWIERDPRLFADCEFREGILRLYSDPFHFGAACERQNSS